MPITRMTQLDVQDIRHRWETDAVAWEHLPRAAADVRNLLRELRATVAERDTERIARQEAEARERGLMAELRAHRDARGLLED